MVMECKFDSIQEIAQLQKLARTVEEPVFLASPGEEIRVDARSFLGMFTLDFSRPVKVITDSLYVIRRLEHDSRVREGVSN